MKITKIFKKSLAILLATITCFTIVACKDDPITSINTDFPSGGDNDLVSTGKCIVDTTKQVQSEYKILMPQQEKIDKNVSIAIEELQLGIKICSGYEMAITNKYEAGQKYLSVGETALYEANKTVVDGDGLETTEVRVVTVGDNVIMMGGNTQSIAYSVYEFMEQSFKLKWYSHEDYYVEEATQIELFDFNFAEEPALDFRMLFQYDYIALNETRNNLRMRTCGWEESLMIPGHTMIPSVLPKDMYAEAHPEWYSKPGGTATDGQICVTNPEALAEFIERAKQIILQEWELDETKSYFMIGMGDNWDYCKCANCEAQAKKFAGYQSGNYIAFANKVSRAINEWVDTVKPGTTIYFPMFAYFYNIEAPVVMSDNGTYVPAHPDAQPDPEVLILYAPLKNHFTYSFDDPRNDQTYPQLTRWEAVTNKNLLVYSYAFHEDKNGFMPFNDIVTMGASINRAINNNYFGWLEESGTLFHHVNMHKLRNYVRSQLWWGTDMSVDELAWEFIDFYYRPVAEDFKKYYTDLKQWLTYLIEVKKVTIDVGRGEYGNIDNWPLNVLDHFDGRLVAMLDKIEHFKEEDLDKYQTYFDRVNCERLWPSYLMCEYYQKYLTRDEFMWRVDFVDVYSREYNVLQKEQTFSRIEAWRTSIT